VKMPYFTFNDKKIFYQIKQSESNQALIFIHGSGGSSNNWKNQLKNLNLGMKLIAIDLPSHAKSEPFSELSLDLYVNAVKTLKHLLNLKSITLSGHSLGGAVIQSYYFKYPDDVKALILVGTGSKLRVSSFILNSLQNNYQQFLDSLPSGAFYRKTPKIIIDEFLYETTKIGPEVSYTDFKICDGFDTLNKTSTIKVPCLIIVGAKDSLTPIKYSNYFHEKIEKSELVIIEKAGHMVMLEKPEEFNQAIENFMKNL